MKCETGLLSAFKCVDVKRHLIYYLLRYNVTEDAKLNFNHKLIIVICGLTSFPKL